MSRLHSEVRKLAKAAFYGPVTFFIPDPILKFLAPAIPYVGFAFRATSMLGGVALIIDSLNRYENTANTIMGCYYRKEYSRCAKLAGQLAVEIVGLGFHSQSEYSHLFLFPNFPTKNFLEMLGTIGASLFFGYYVIVNLVYIVESYFSRAEERERVSVLNNEGQLWLSNLATTETDEGFIINCRVTSNRLMVPILNVSITNAINSHLPTINRNIYLTQTAIESYQLSNNNFFRNINVQNDTISLLVPRPLEHEGYISHNVSISIELGQNNEGVIQRINRDIGRLSPTNEPEILAGAAV